MDTDPNPVDGAVTPATQELDTLRLPSPPVDAQQVPEPPPAAPAPVVAPVPTPPATILTAAVPPASVPAPEPAVPMDSMLGAEANHNVMEAQAMTPGPRAYATDADTDDYKRSFALNLTLRKKPKCVFAMAMGIAEFDGILDRPPLTSVKRKELTDLYVPKADDFKHEIKRRAHFFMNVAEEASYFTDELKRHHPLKTKRSSVVLPQPNQWLNSALKRWLLERPMKPNDNDIEFLRSEIHEALNYLSRETKAEVGGFGMVKAETAGPSTPLTPKSPAMYVPERSPVTAAPIFNIGDVAAEPHAYMCPKDTEEFKRSAAATFAQRNHRPRAILAMALGMEEFNALLDHPPFTLVKKKDLMEDHIPRAEDYRFEIKRRAHFFMNMEEETDYYTKILGRKNPLENMRGIVAVPQPNQWKLQQLKGWLMDRPLKYNAKDSAFLRLVIKKLVDALNSALQSDPTHGVDRSPGKKPPSAAQAMKQAWMAVSDANSVDSNGPGSKRREALLLECITKQDAILGAVNKQTQQQTILNKITVLTQAISGYQQEVSSLRSTINDVDNRILTVEMRMAEAPESEERLRTIVAKQQDAKNQAEVKVRELEQLILESRGKIENHSHDLEQLEVEMNGATSKKRKFGEEQMGALEHTIV